MPQEAVDTAQNGDISENIATDKNVARFINEVDAALNGTMPHGKTILIGNPNSLLAKYMNSTNPIRIPQTVVKKIVRALSEYGGKHGFSDLIYQLPFQLSDPLAITGNTTEHAQKGDNSIVVWTDWMTEAGDSIIIPIRIDISGRGGTYNNVNSMFDVYDKSYEQDLLRDGNVFYTKDNRSIEELLSQRREVPKVIRSDASINNIHDEAEKVNPNEYESNAAVDEAVGEQVADTPQVTESAIDEYEARTTDLSGDDYISIASAAVDSNALALDNANKTLREAKIKEEKALHRSTDDCYGW